MYKGKNVIAVTLARGGSKSIPKKNIINLNGYPLIQYTIKETQKSKYIDKYIISTDDKEIKETCEKLGCECPFYRPVSLSADTATSADALIHAVKFLDDQGEKYDYVVEVMATNPLKIVEDIDKCIEIAIDGDNDACVAVNRLFDQHPSRIKYIENGYLRSFYPEIPESRRQDLKPEAYIRSGSIYVTKISFLLEHKSRYSSETTKAYIIPNDRVINIDNPIDLELAKIKLK